LYQFCAMVNCVDRSCRHHMAHRPKVYYSRVLMRSIMCFF
jgi:hypothetical protein